MKNKNKNTNVIKFNLKEHSRGYVNRNSSVDKKIDYISTNYSPSSYDLIDIKNGLEVTLQTRFYNIRNSKGQFSRR